MNLAEPYAPLAADHPAVRDGQVCPECETAFVAGDVTNLLPIATGDGLTCEAVLLHHACAAALVASVAAIAGHITKTVTSLNAETLRDPLWESRQMDDLGIKGKARQAIFHVLGQIRSNPTVGYELGIGSQSFALLTEAYAAIACQPLEQVRQHFLCRNAAKAGQADKERLDWLGERLSELPQEILGLIGLTRAGAGLRDSIDKARQQP